MESYIILHDITGSFLLLEKGQSKHDAPHLIFLTNKGTQDDLARQIYHQITGEESDSSRDPPLSVRYCIRDDGDDDGPVIADIVEPIGRRCTIRLTADYTWTRINPVLMNQMKDRYSPLIVQAINNIAGETLDNSSNDSVPWFAKRGCMKEVRETIRSRLKDCGYGNIRSVEHRYSTPNSVIYSIDVGETCVFYKLSVCGRPEALFTQTLARLLPDHVLIPFGVDIDENSFFTEGFGDTVWDAVRYCDDEDIRKHLIEPSINTIAGFHEKASKHVEEFKRLGMEDTSPEQMRIELPRFICELQERGILNEREAGNMRDLVPLIVSKLDVLTDGKIPLTVCHGDLHYGNVTQPCAKDGVPLLFDWYESSISHPFLDFMYDTFARGPWIRLYAEKWRGYDSSDKLIDMLLTARALQPLWITFRLVKTVVKRGHQLGAKQDWDLCRVIMTGFIEVLLEEKAGEIDIT